MAGAGKRAATSDLNHDNWDRAEEPEEQGEFRAASGEELQRRVIRTARRRASRPASAAPATEEPKSIFGSFKGFNKAAPSSFDFLSKLTNGSETKSLNGSTHENNDSLNATVMFGSPVSSSTGIFSTSPTAAKTPAFGTVPSSAESKSTTNLSPSNTSKPGSMFEISTSKNAPSFSFQGKSSPSNEKSPAMFGIPTPNSVKPVTFGIPPISKPIIPSNLTNSVAVNQSIKKAEPKIENNDMDITKHKISKEEYYSKLKGLNESVSEWIKQHVSENPLCILTPIFKDYQKYLTELHKEHGEPNIKMNGTDQFEDKDVTVVEKAKDTLQFVAKTNSLISAAGSQQKVGSLTSIASTTPSFSFGIKPSTVQDKKNDEKKAQENSGTLPTSGASPFSLFSNNSSTSQFSKPSTGISSTSTATASTPFSFGINTSPQTTLGSSTPKTSTVAPFSFGTGKPFSFNSNIEQKSEQQEGENKEDEDEPPKVEFTPIVEENSVFDKRCKVFFKKDGNFVDKGVGTLYVKTIENSSKHQIIVRANTTLGTVLLNFILSDSIPTQRMGKNNVMMVCIPTPDSKPPPIPVLIRVKTSEEADDLLETLNKYKI